MDSRGKVHRHLTISHMNNISKVLALSTIYILTISLSGCRGSAGKRATTEAIEFIERKTASSGASAIEREVSQVERGTIREAESYNSGRSRTHRPRHNSYDEEESSYQTQVHTVACSQCGGGGTVYVLDYYGNMQYDYYGYPVISQCPSCGGSGYILVNE